MGELANPNGTFGELVRQRRMAVGLTQEELAERTGLSVRALSDLERGVVSRPHRSSVSVLTEALGLDLSVHDELGLGAATNPDDCVIHGNGGGAGNGHAGWPYLVVPRQLPAVGSFAGRTTELSMLHGVLGHVGGPRGTAVIVTVGGTAGVGKTALAMHWAHQVADRFPDGQIYVNLRGFDPRAQPMPPAEAVRGFLDALGVPAGQIPAGVDAQTGMFRSLLARDKRILLLLDNARDAEQVRALLPGSSSCLTIVTSRGELTGLAALEGAHQLALDVLSESEARQLLAMRLGNSRLAAEPGAASELIELCARLPLALAIAAARAAQPSDLPLATLVAELRGASDRLDALSTGEQASDLRAVFSCSYEALSQPARRIFRLLGIHPGPDVSAPVAASLAGAGVGVRQAQRLLAELTRSNLLVQHAPGRYGFHDLLRAYAAECAGTEEPGTAREAAVRRLLDHYLHSADAADRVLYPARDPIALDPPAAGVTPEHPAGHDQALAWFEAEHKALLAAVNLAEAAGLLGHAWQLPWVLADFLDRRGHWSDWAAVQRVAVAAATSSGDQVGMASAHRALGGALIQLGSYQDARTHLRRARSLNSQLGDRVGQARASLNLAWLSELEGSYPSALADANRALELFRQASNRAGEGRALNIVGWYHAQMSDHERAVAFCEQAVELCQELDDRLGEAAAWDSLGYAHRHLGHHRLALTCSARAIDLTEQLGERYRRAGALINAGDTHLAAADPLPARRAWREALAILDELHHPDAELVRRKLAGPH
jgi:tetratricopeptide (TPR) repeat protein/transcriptional regulator with XRE-family HTH domain